MATHKDWDEVRQKRDSRARLAARAMITGRHELAMDYAKQYDEWEQEMSRLALILEATDDA